MMVITQTSAKAGDHDTGLQTISRVFFRCGIAPGRGRGGADSWLRERDPLDRRKAVTLKNIEYPSNTLRFRESDRRALRLQGGVPTADHMVPSNVVLRHNHHGRVTIEARKLVNPT